jgi:hypothetical protein
MVVFRFWCVFLVLILITFSRSNCWSQESCLDRNQQITILGSAKLGAVIKIIERESCAIFSFDSKKMDAALNFTMPPGNVTIESIFKKIHSLGIRVDVVDNYVILAIKENKEEEKVMKQSQRTSYPVKKTPIDTTKKRMVLMDSTVISLSNDSIVDPVHPLVDANYQEPDLTDHVHVVDFGEAGDRMNKSVSNLVDSQVNSEQKLLAKKQEQFNNQPKNEKLFLRIGFGGTELLPVGPSLQFGTPFFFGLLSYTTNFNVTVFNYGVGSSIPIGKQSRMGLLFDYGENQNKYALERSGFSNDTSKVVVKGKLGRVSLVYERTIVRHFKMQIGIQYNWLQTHYSINGINSSIGFLGANSDQQFYTIRPFYTFTNTYSDNSHKNVKTWLGAQFNFSYTINISKQR